MDQYGDLRLFYNENVGEELITLRTFFLYK